MNKTALDLLEGTNIEIDFQNFVINLFIVGILSYFIKLLYIRFSTTLFFKQRGVFKILLY